MRETETCDPSLSLASGARCGKRACPVLDCEAAPGSLNATANTDHLHAITTEKPPLLMQDPRNSFVVSTPNKSKKKPRSHDRGIFL